MICPQDTKPGLNRRFSLYQEWNFWNFPVSTSEVNWPPKILSSLLSASLSPLHYRSLLLCAAPARAAFLLTTWDAA